MGSKKNSLFKNKKDVDSQKDSENWLMKFEKPYLGLKDEEKSKLLDFIHIYEKEIKESAVKEIEKVFVFFKKSKWKNYRNSDHKQAMCQTDYPDLINNSFGNVYIDDRKDDDRKAFLGHLRNSIAHGNFCYSKESGTFEFLDKFTKSEKNKNRVKGDISSYIRLDSDSMWRIINGFTNYEKKL